ncbi:MAG: LPXTG cell wall anchor domain-containing protein, partial [Candidatus Hydrothermarchaeales archaeon]
MGAKYDEVEIANSLANSIKQKYQTSEIKIRKDASITDEDKKNFHLILLGGPTINLITAEFVTMGSSLHDWDDNNGYIEIFWGYYARKAIILGGKNSDVTIDAINIFLREVGIAQQTASTETPIPITTSPPFPFLQSGEPSIEELSTTLEESSPTTQPPTKPSETTLAPRITQPPTQPLTKLPQTSQSKSTRFILFIVLALVAGAAFLLGKKEKRSPDTQPIEEISADVEAVSPSEFSKPPSTTSTFPPELQAKYLFFEAFLSWREPFFGLTVSQWGEERKEAYARFRRIFDPSHVEDMTKEDFHSFLDFNINKSWTGLYRRGGEATKDMKRLREAIAFLQDESIDIKTRINEVLRPTGSYKISGMGKNIATAILHISYPDKYTV